MRLTLRVKLQSSAKFLPIEATISGVVGSIRSSNLVRLQNKVVYLVFYSMCWSGIRYVNEFSLLKLILTLDNCA